MLAGSRMCIQLPTPYSNEAHPGLSFRHQFIVYDLKPEELLAFWKPARVCSENRLHTLGSAGGAQDLSRWLCHNVLFSS